MKLLRNLTGFLLYSNVFIALCAVALVFTNQLTIGTGLSMDDSCWFVFFSTIFTYSVLKFRKPDDDAHNTTHQSWAVQHSQLYRNIIVISLLATGAFFITLNFTAQLIVAGLAVVTAFYGFVNIPFVNPPRRLRHFGMLKTVFVGLVWSVTTVLIPFAGEYIQGDVLTFLLLRRFLFVLALTMVFEIKDLEHDRQSSLNTLPMVFGVSGTKVLAQLTLFLLIVINTVQYFFYDIALSNMLAVNLSLIISMVCIHPVNKNTPDYWYYLVLDGMMLLQFILVYIAYLVTA